MPPYFVTGLLFSLIPLKSKAAREEAVFILRNGRWDWKEKNEDGYQLHTGMIRGGRVDLAAEAARNIRKRDAKNPELSQVWAALLTYLIQRQHRTAALSMMEKGVLKSENWRERFEILGKNTVILSSHILSEVQNMCDEILIISKGKLIAYDTAENLEKMFQPKSAIEMLTDAGREEAEQVLSGIEGIEDVAFEDGDGGMLQIRIETVPEKVAPIMRVLSIKFAEVKRAVLKMDIVKANLEEIFIELTSSEGEEKENSGEEEEEKE